MSVGAILDKITCWLLIVVECTPYTETVPSHGLWSQTGEEKNSEPSPSVHLSLSPCFAIRFLYRCFCPWTWGKATFNLSQVGQTPTSFYLRLLLLLGLEQPTFSRRSVCRPLPYREIMTCLDWLCRWTFQLPTCFISNATVICVGWFTSEWLSIREVYSWIFDLLNKQLSTSSFINCSENLQFR